MDFQLLHQLPEELLQDILERLDSHTLASLALTSHWCYQVAVQWLWREVELTDCRTQYEDGRDEHDDTPLIKKLLVLATKPWVASSVHVLTHRCHLPPPAIFNELPHSPFSSQTLSSDPRTIRLAQLAVQHMTRVHTLRLIFGHPNLNDALLRCFFDKNRSRETPIRRLWLENCRISAGCQLQIQDHPYGLPLELNFDGLETLRLRRMPLRPGMEIDERPHTYHYLYARGHDLVEMQDGQGAFYETTMTSLSQDQSLVHAHIDRAAFALPAENRTEIGQSLLEIHFQCANIWDDRIYESIFDCASPAQQLAISERHEPSHRKRSELACRGPWLDPLDSYSNSGIEGAFQREKLPSSVVALAVFGSCSSTLTSLTFDWLFTLPATVQYAGYPKWQRRWADLFLGLFSLRFPRLRAFQFRNAVVEGTRLPEGLYLLDRSWIRETVGVSLDISADDRNLLDIQQWKLATACLGFVEAHSNLECLAWPMDHFFSERSLPSDIASRVEAVIQNLGRTLTELRVDYQYSGVGESQSEGMDAPLPKARARRRRFIEDFASKMTKIEVLKIEGGMPRDERREIIRALHACPVRKIVLIGVCSPLGNTWGYEGSDLSESLSPDELEHLEGEDKAAIWELGPRDPERPRPDCRFEATYGWPAGPPMASIIAAYHADTITELKFCGYKGSPVLLSPTRVTTPMLSALRHFHKLDTLIISLWLTTMYENSARDSEIISYWQNARSPVSMALVRITDEEPEGWEKELRTKYAPNALAWRITSFLGPFLSERAKARKEGVHVRASFCVGQWGGIFDVDLWIGKGSLGSDICLNFKGPREELELERRQSKLENRRWF